MFVSETRHKVADLLASGASPSEIARALALSKPTISYHMRRLGHEPDHRYGRRYDWVAVQRYYDAGHTFRECQAAFGFNGATWSDAVRRGVLVPRPQAMPIAALLTGPRSRGHLKARLIAAGLKSARCEACGIDSWRDRPLSLALHHVNGVKDDNRLENLQLLCPNCHSQTENFSGRNKRRAGDAEAAA
jgi:hypothetical protein